MYQPEYRIFRTILTGFLPAIIGLIVPYIQFTMGIEYSTTSLNYLELSILISGTGMIVYTIHFPEKYYPKKFDLLGVSHQIWHVCAVIT
jgi:adiponectin receptor